MSARVLTRMLALSTVFACAVAAPTGAAALGPSASPPSGYRVVSADAPAVGNNYDTASAYCPSNMAVVGGGYATSGGAMVLTEMSPIGVNGWAVFVYNSAPGEGTVTAYAECSSRVRNDHQPQAVAFYPPAHREATRTRGCPGAALAVGAQGSSYGVPVNRIAFAANGRAVTGGVYNRTGKVGWAYLYRLCAAARPATTVRSRTFHGTSTSRIITARLHCPPGSAFTEGGFAMAPPPARVAESRPVHGGTGWAVTARFPAARRSNTLTVSGDCLT